jgi:transcriptional antiterminator RfaH
MKEWYLIKTKTRQENLAISNLQNQGYHVYCPCGEINNKIVTLFPGYIFIYLDKNSQNWSPIRSTKGVQNFIRFGLEYAKIPNKVVEYIRTNEIITSKKLQILNDFKPGDQVQITDGTLKNCTAIFRSFKSDIRVIILMNILGQEQTISINKKSLVAL